MYKKMETFIQLYNNNQLHSCFDSTIITSISNQHYKKMFDEVVNSLNTTIYELSFIIDEEVGRRQATLFKKCLREMFVANKIRRIKIPENFNYKDYESEMYYMMSRRYRLPMDYTSTNLKKLLIHYKQYA